MSHFLQIHMLTPYHPSNLNRDDLGRPKTAFLGGRLRLRISSQSLKRAWRTSELFQDAFAGQLGTRTKMMGNEIKKMLVQKGVDEKAAEEWAGSMAGVFGKPKVNAPLEIEQLAHFSPEEREALASLVGKLAQSGTPPTEEDLALLRHPGSAVDIALFGRMLAQKPTFNVEAALQVAHAITVNEAPVEDDYFTAVDDLNQGLEDVGAGHIGDAEFGAGVFYLYLCLDCGLLLANLAENQALARKTVATLIETAATVAPTGKQNSFASRSLAHYILLEHGTRQPRSLASSFISPIKSPDQLGEAIRALEDMVERQDNAYGQLAEKRSIMNIVTRQGTLRELQGFAEESICPNS